MNSIRATLLLACISSACVHANPNRETVQKTQGLVAFWEFSNPREGLWWSHTNMELPEYPLYARRIGDPIRHRIDQWPYTDTNATIRIDTSGPFGHGIQFNKGYIYAECPRASFDGSPLDLCGRKPFTLIAWAKFTGARHMIAGIWDEGGWDKYRGRRQVALFGGLFGQSGLTAHISGTGAASYPQSTVNGSQYARARAIDGAALAQQEWACLAMTFNPETREVYAYKNGKATALTLGDPVANDVFTNANAQAANPYLFDWNIYSPRRFLIKYNGYSVRTQGVYEHWLDVEAAAGRATYGRSAPHPVSGRFKISITTKGKTCEYEVTPGATIALPEPLTQGDTLVTALYTLNTDTWVQVGSTITYPIPEGAPFTLGRALGLGSESLNEGSKIVIDGVAVFNRVLSSHELEQLSFHATPCK